MPEENTSPDESRVVVDPGNPSNQISPPADQNTRTPDSTEVSARQREQNAETQKKSELREHVMEAVNRRKKENPELFAEKSSKEDAEEQKVIDAYRESKQPAEGQQQSPPAEGQQQQQPATGQQQPAEVLKGLVTPQMQQQVDQLPPEAKSMFDQVAQAASNRVREAAAALHQRNQTAVEMERVLRNPQIQQALDPQMPVAQQVTGALALATMATRNPVDFLTRIANYYGVDLNAPAEAPASQQGSEQQATPDDPMAAMQDDPMDDPQTKQMKQTLRNMYAQQVQVQQYMQHQQQAQMQAQMHREAQHNLNYLFQWSSRTRQDGTPVSPLVADGNNPYFQNIGAQIVQRARQMMQGGQQVDHNTLDILYQQIVRSNPTLQQAEQAILAQRKQQAAAQQPSPEPTQQSQQPAAPAKPAKTPDTGGQTPKSSKLGAGAPAGGDAGTAKGPDGRAETPRDAVVLAMRQRAALKRQAA